jgi:hypothetical protein
VRPNELVEYLRAATDPVVPFVGAGLAIAAGATPTETLAEELACRAKVPARSLRAVTEAAEQTIGGMRTNETVAAIFAERPLRPTPTLVTLAQWPAQRILTTNYDRAIEVSVRMAGRRPVTLLPGDADTLVAPEPGVVQVIHLHGVDTDPDSIVLPGRDPFGLSSKATSFSRTCER